MLHVSLDCPFLPHWFSLIYIYIYTCILKTITLLGAFHCATHLHLVTVVVVIVW
jgi:hypothetical protein